VEPFNAPEIASAGFDNSLLHLCIFASISLMALLLHGVEGRCPALAGALAAAVEPLNAPVPGSWRAVSRTRSLAILSIFTISLAISCIF